MTLYDEVEYPSRAFSQTHPERAAAIGTLFGMNPPAPATCRVLEVGCGTGWNLIPMAAELPHAQFFGFDLADSAIAAARGDAEQLRLSNLRFETMDLMEFPEGAGEFDYIIAHGFYSWVPRPVRRKLLEVCRRHLAPQGLAFISYNAFPYARLRLMWREMMLYHLDHSKSSGTAESPARRLALSEKLLRVLSGQWSDSNRLRHHATLLNHQISAVSEGGGNWFFHDDLGPVFDPLTISEFAAEAESCGLQYVSEALFEQMNCDNMPTAFVEAAGTDWIAREQYLDYFIQRGFRMSLIAHSGAGAIHRPPRDVCFERLLYSAPLVRTGPRTYRNEATRAEAESEDPSTLAALEKIAKAWPRNLRFRDMGIPATALLQLIVSTVIEPSVTPRRGAWSNAALRPCVWAPARLQASRGKVVTSRLHGAIQLEQAPLRELAAGLDGTRPFSDFAALFSSERELRKQIDWLERAALLE